jgi:hypothetical protein
VLADLCFSFEFLASGEGVGWLPAGPGFLRPGSSIALTVKFEGGLRSSVFELSKQVEGLKSLGAMGNELFLNE